MISSRLPGRSLLFFVNSARDKLQLLHQRELRLLNRNGRHMYKSRVVKWLTLASSTRAMELPSMEMVVIGTSCVW